jgi:glycosyltransferase involved in cell wall biosynthesis
MSNQGSPPMDAESPLMRRATTHLSLVVGCYNAARHLEKRLLDLVTFLDGAGRDYEVLIVEDGSLDDSLPILRRLEADVSRISVIRNPRNMGKGYSIRNGILNSRGKYIIFTDIDMAYSKRNLLAVLEKLESGDPLVVGNRRLPESVYVVNNTLVKYVYRRHRMGVAFNALVRLLFGLTTRDTQSGLKGFSRSTAARIFQQLHTDGFLFDIEIFIRSRTLGIPVTEVPVQLTYEDDITTVGQFRYLLTVIPELIHIKMLEIRGAYEHGATLRMPHEGQTATADTRAASTASATIQASGTAPPASTSAGAGNTTS